jgi:hypothetical protein
MPTTAQSTFEPSANRIDPVFAPDLSRVLGVAPNPSSTSTATVTYTRGTIMAEFSATSLAGVYAPYSSSASANGLNNPKGILQYTVTVDSLGNVQLAGEFGQTQRGAPMWMPGGAIWRIQDLSGLDANAVTVMAGAVVEGSVASGAGLIKL